MNSIDRDKKTILFYAKQNENEELIQFLSTKGASVLKDGKASKNDNIKRKKENQNQDQVDKKQK